MRERKTKLHFDNFISEFLDITNGCDQGCPLSVFCYLFYNADLLDIARPKEREMVIAFMDDVNLIKAAKTFNAANSGLINMMERPGGAQEWSMANSSDFEMDKLKLVGFTRKREQHITPKTRTRPLRRHNIRIGQHVVKHQPHIDTWGFS